MGPRGPEGLKGPRARITAPGTVRVPEGTEGEPLGEPKFSELASVYNLSAGKRDRGKIAAPPPPLRSRGGGGAGAKPPTLPCEAGRGGQEVKSVYPLDVGCRFSLYSRI